MRKIKGYTGWAAALLLAFFAMACLLGSTPAQAAGDWTLVDDPCVAGISPYGVFAASPSDVWVVGSGGAIVHYNGSAWEAVSSGTTNELKGVWDSGPGDVYAVGSSGTIVHYNGTNWSPMTSGVTNTLYGVWGSGPTDVYAVGSSGKILHYNGTGTNWSLMTSGTTRTLYGVWGSGLTDVYAAGGSSTNTTVVHYEGTETGWSNVSTGAYAPGLKGVWGSGPTDVYAVGVSGSILHYDGSAWTVTYVSPAPDLTGISGSGNDVYAVGGGVVYRYTVQSSIEAPEITPNGGAYETPQSVTVSISAAPAAGQSIYYTTDGSDPTVAGSVYYTGPFALHLAAGTTTVKAAVYDSGSGRWSGVSQAVFTVSGALAAPEITPNGGVFEAPQSVTASISADLTAGQSIYYTTDGSAPTVAGGVYYTGPFTLQLEHGETTVKAAVYDTGSGQWSGVSQAVFTVTGASGPAAPVVTGVSPTWGPVAGGTAVTVTGANLSTVQAVYFGGNAGTGLTVNSGASLTVTSPSGSGTVDVIASGPGGASAATPAARFAYRMSAGELTGERVIAALPGSDTVLPFELYPGQRGFSNEPCFITVPAGTGQITIKKDPAKSITSLTVYDAGGNAFPADEGQLYSVTVPAAATRQAPYRINYNYEHYSINIYFYCVEENAPNPFVTPYNELTVAEGAVISLNVTGAGTPPQAAEWYYGYNVNSSYEKIYQKLEGQTGAALNIAVSQDALNLGYLDEAYGKYYLRFYAKMGGHISNQVSVVVNETSVTGARSLSADNWGSYAGARLWLNVGAAFGNMVDAGTPVKFYLTAAANGTPDTAVAGTLLETTAAAVPAAAYREKGMGFLAGPLPAGDYWLALQVGTGENASCRYRPFTVYPGVREYVKAALDRMISYYQTKGFVKNGTYVGLSERIDDFGTDWVVWMLCNYGHTVSDSLMAGADGKTYLDSLDEVLSNREQQGDQNSAKDGFRYVAALCAAGADPRDFNGRNLVTELISRAYDEDGTLKLDENGALVGQVDILSASYLMLGAEIACATEAEGYTDALKKAGIKRILPDVERSVNAQSAAEITSTDWLAMMSYPLYFLQGDDEYGDRITAAIGKMADMVSAYQYANGGLNLGLARSRQRRLF